MKRAWLGRQRLEKLSTRMRRYVDDPEKVSGVPEDADSTLTE